MKIAVVGLGQIGLPLAAQFASRGHHVLGCDIDPSVVALVNRGVVTGDEPWLAQRVRDAVRDGRLSAQTTTAEAVRQSNVVVVIVPLVVDDELRVDYRGIDAATADIAAGLQPGTLVIYETTLPVGDTRRRFGPSLARGSGLRLGDDFFLAFSPERVYVGRVFQDLRRYPKIIGGVDAESTRRAKEFYEAALEPGTELTVVPSAETAEFVKIAETTYRDVNIALANEFARYADEVGVDVLEVIAAANSQPYSHIHQPGLGVGGHCIPVYPRFFTARASRSDLAGTARQINDGMSGYAVTLLREALGNVAGRRVAIFGYAYRENVKEAAFSVASRLIASLRQAGADVLLHDPLYTPSELERLGVEFYDLSLMEPVDAIVLQAGHDQYRQLDLTQIEGLRVVLDGRNFWSPSDMPDGVRFMGIGRGGSSPAHDSTGQPEHPAAADADSSPASARDEPGSKGGAELVSTKG